MASSASSTQPIKTPIQTIKELIHSMISRRHLFESLKVIKKPNFSTGVVHELNKIGHLFYPIVSDGKNMLMIRDVKIIDVNGKMRPSFFGKRIISWPSDHEMEDMFMRLFTNLVIASPDTKKTIELLTDDYNAVIKDLFRACYFHDSDSDGKIDCTILQCCIHSKPKNGLIKICDDYTHSNGVITFVSHKDEKYMITIKRFFAIGSCEWPESSDDHFELACDDPEITILAQQYEECVSFEYPRCYDEMTQVVEQLLKMLGVAVTGEMVRPMSAE